MTMNTPITTTNNPRMEQLLHSAGSSTANPGLIINQAISTPHLYHFGELLYYYNSSNNNNSLNEKDRLLLEIFCYGTVKDAMRYEAVVSFLNPKQWFKLRQLSFISLIHKCLEYSSGSSSSGDVQNRNIPYALIVNELGLSTADDGNIGDGAMRELEELIISCIYDNLVKGKMDHRNKCFIARMAVSRDIRLDNLFEAKGSSSSIQSSSLSDMIERLNAFQVKTQDVLNNVLKDQCSKYCADVQEKEDKQWKQVTKSVQHAARTSRTGSLDFTAFGLDPSIGGTAFISRTSTGDDACEDTAHKDRKNKRSRAAHGINVFRQD